MASLFVLALISLRLQLCSELLPQENELDLGPRCGQNAPTHTHIPTVGRLKQDKHKEASLPSVQRASQLASNCLALTSRTFFSTNEAGGRRSVCVTFSYSARCVSFGKIGSGETNAVGPTAHFQWAVWNSLEGMRGWITLLAAIATFQWGSTLSSPLSNPCWNEHLWKIIMRPEMEWPACLLQLWR